MKVIGLDTVEEATSTYTHKFRLFAVTDVNAAATSQIITLLANLPQGCIIFNPALYLPTAFSGGSATGLTVSLGVDHASTTDVPTSLINAAEILAAGRLAVVDGTGTAQAANRTGTGIIDSGGGSLIATFTATGANLSTLTAGEVHLFCNVQNLAKLG